jgi:hypothetical protein
VAIASREHPKMAKCRPGRSKEKETEGGKKKAAGANSLWLARYCCLPLGACGGEEKTARRARARPLPFATRARDCQSILFGGWAKKVIREREVRILPYRRFCLRLSAPPATHSHVSDEMVVSVFAVRACHPSCLRTRDKCATLILFQRRAREAQDLLRLEWIFLHTFCETD